MTAIRLICAAFLALSLTAAAVAQDAPATFETQRALSFLGFDPGPVDGQWGRKTEAALAAFLAAEGSDPQTLPQAARLDALRAAVAARRAGRLTSYQYESLHWGPPFPAPVAPSQFGGTFREIHRAPIDIDGDGTAELFIAKTSYSLDKPRQEAGPGLFAFLEAVPGRWAYLRDRIEPGVAACVHPRQPVVADFNSDARPDVFVACHGYDKPPFAGETNRMLLSQGDTFQMTVPSDDIGFSHGAAAADFNNDGVTDLVVTDGTRKDPVLVLINDGAGTFTRSARFIPPALKGHHNYFSVGVPDINGDGFFDLVVGGHEWETAPTLAFLNPGNGDFSRATPLSVPAVAGFGVVLDYLVTDLRGERRLWVLRTTGGGDGYYDGVALQSVSLPDMRSELPFQRRGIRWITNIVSWNEDGKTFVGADQTHSEVVLALD